MLQSFKKHIPYLIGRYLHLLFLVRPKKAVHQAFTLFCTPRNGKVLPDQEYYLEYAEDEVITVDHTEIQTYRWKGMGDTILLVHGWESNSHRWNVLIKKLQRLHYNIIAFDAPAHGYSTGPILNVPLYDNCLQKVIELYRPNHIIGHSIGGMTVLYNQYKYQNPETEKLIILGAPAELSRITKEFQDALQLSKHFMQALEKYFSELYGYKFTEFSTCDFVQQIQTKGLIIHDLHDPVAPIVESKNVHHNWKNSELLTTQGVGHSLRSETVDHAIISFLES